MATLGQSYVTTVCDEQKHTETKYACINVEYISCNAFWTRWHHWTHFNNLDIEIYLKELMC